MCKVLVEALSAPAPPAGIQSTTACFDQIYKVLDDLSLPKLTKLELIWVLAPIDKCQSEYHAFYGYDITILLKVRKDMIWNFEKLLILKAFSSMKK